MVGRGQIVVQTKRINGGIDKEDHALSICSFCCRTCQLWKQLLTISCRLLSGNPTIFSIFLTTSSTDMFSLTFILQIRFPTSALMMNSNLYPLASRSFRASSRSSIPKAPPSLLPLRYGFRLLMRLIYRDFCMRARCSLMPEGTTSGQAGTGCARKPWGNSSCSSMTMVLQRSRSGRGGVGRGSRQREAASSERGLSSGSNLHCLNSSSMRLRASRFLRQVWTSWRRKSWWLRSDCSASPSSPPAISFRYPSTTDRITLKNASSSRSRSLRNLPLNSMNLKKILFSRASVCSAGRAASSSVTRMSKTSPVGTQSSPKLMSLSTRQALTMARECLPTASSDSCSRAHSSKVQQPFSERFCCCRMTSFSSSGFTLRPSSSAINVIAAGRRANSISQQDSIIVSMAANHPRFLSTAPLHPAHQRTFRDPTHTHAHHEQQLSNDVQTVLNAHPRASRDYVKSLLDEFMDPAKVIAILNTEKPQLPTLPPLSLSLEEENAILKRSFINLHGKLKRSEQEREELREKLRRAEEENMRLRETNELLKGRHGNLI